MKDTDIPGVKRQDWFVTLCMDYPLTLYFKAVHHFTFKDSHYLCELKDNPFVLLPRHQRFADVLLEGILLRETVGRNANYVMKASLPRILQYGGGLIVTRGKDLKKLSLKQKKNVIFTAKEENRKLYEETVAGILNAGGIFVLHPQGTRDIQGDIKDVVKKNLKHLIQLTQPNVTDPITYVPLNIEYGERTQLTVGKPIIDKNITAEQLADKWLRAINL